jgi:hypothetical protein
MSKPKKVEIDLSKPYEENDIKLRGTVIFCAVTFLMILFSFVSMYFVNKWVEAGMADYDKKNEKPMAFSKEEKLPPEPRLQLAPGFGVGEGENRVNLELLNPHAEYWEVRKRWNQIEKEGAKDPHTGAVLAIPMAEAKTKLLEKGEKQRPAEDAQKAMQDASSIYSGSSSGRAMTGR